MNLGILFPPVVKQCIRDTVAWAERCSVLNVLWLLEKEKAGTLARPAYLQLKPLA